MPLNCAQFQSRKSHGTSCDKKADGSLSSVFWTYLIPSRSQNEKLKSPSTDYIPHVPEWKVAILCTAWYGSKQFVCCSPPKNEQNQQTLNSESYDLNRIAGACTRQLPKLSPVTQNARRKREKLRRIGPPSVWGNGLIAYTLLSLSLSLPWDPLLGSLYEAKVNPSESLVKCKMYPAKSLTFGGLMENPLVGKKLKS